MKKLLEKKITVKTLIISITLTIILLGGTCVAAVSLVAKDIGFTSTNEEWNPTNVEVAMNDLYRIGNVKIPESYNEGYNIGYNAGYSAGSIRVSKVFSAQTAASRVKTLTKSYTITENGTYRFIVMNSNYKPYMSTQTLTKNGTGISLSSPAIHYPKYDATYTYISSEVNCVVGDVITSTFVSNVTGDDVWTPYTTIIPIRLS